MPKSEKPTNAQRAKSLILRGEIKTLEALLLIVKPTPLAHGMGITPARFRNVLADLSLVTFADINKIASYLGVDEDVIHTMFLVEYKRLKKRR